MSRALGFYGKHAWAAFTIRAWICAEWALPLALLGCAFWVATGMKERSHEIVPDGSLWAALAAGIVLVAIAQGLYVQHAAKGVRGLIWQRRRRRLAQLVAFHVDRRRGDIHSWTSPRPGAAAMDNAHFVLCDRSTGYRVVSCKLSLLLGAKFMGTRRPKLVIAYRNPVSGSVVEATLAFENCAQADRFVRRFGLAHQQPCAGRHAQLHGTMA
ncbi:hypothetical protein M2333_000240 [Sphingobium sp. B11D3B]|uniref:hypothetical protein n=1 Tax=Sphingobium sp. B11D3B TaxID=2940575 RepID=UPI002225E771|nr:hypothetical protein [Sphingobium sp. B11D3B]MCW2387194.1 hypothetical protein [Sphingobium sp. B11D3B]